MGERDFARLEGKGDKFYYNSPSHHRRNGDRSIVHSTSICKQRGNHSYGKPSSQKQTWCPSLRHSFIWDVITYPCSISLCGTQIILCRVKAISSEKAPTVDHPIEVAKTRLLDPTPKTCTAFVEDIFSRLYCCDNALPPLTKETPGHHCNIQVVFPVMAGDSDHRDKTVVRRCYIYM